jgi:hypothetical protein
MQVRQRPTRWWLETLRKRRERIAGDELDLAGGAITFANEQEREACIRFFNAAYRAEESGLTQAHALAGEVGRRDPELGECLRLYGDEEGWHRELLTSFLAACGGEVRPMGGLTRTMYDAYGRSRDMPTIVLTNLMFETIGSTTYRMALRRVRQPLARQMLTVLTRDEAFHVPLNVHFLREVLGHRRPGVLERARLRLVYHGVFVGLLESARRSRIAARAFDRISFKDLATAYVENLGRLFVNEPDLDFEPPALLLRAFGIPRAKLVAQGAFSPVSADAAAQAADRDDVVVTAL